MVEGGCFFHVLLQKESNGLKRVSYFSARQTVRKSRQGMRRFIKPIEFKRFIYRISEGIWKRGAAGFFIDIVRERATVLCWPKIFLMGFCCWLIIGLLMIPLFFLPLFFVAVEIRRCQVRREKKLLFFGGCRIILSWLPIYIFGSSRALGS